MRDTPLRMFERQFDGVVLKGLYFFTECATGEEFPAFYDSKVFADLLEGSKRCFCCSVPVAAKF